MNTTWIRWSQRGLKTFLWWSPAASYKGGNDLYNAEGGLSVTNYFNHFSVTKQQFLKKTFLRTVSIHWQMFLEDRDIFNTFQTRFNELFGNRISFGWHNRWLLAGTTQRECNFFDSINLLNTFWYLVIISSWTISICQRLGLLCYSSPTPTSSMVSKNINTE